MNIKYTNFVSIILGVTGLGSYMSINGVPYVDGQEDDPLQIISNIKNLLNQTMVEYKSGNYTGASELVDIAYIDNYEYIEDPLKELNKNLMKETEVLIREYFSNAVKEQAPIENINNMYNKIQQNLDLIEDLFRQG